jgi:hypothetical protein
MATYYYSQSTGADGNAGTILAPKQTLADLKGTVGVGDTANLMAGDTWDETLELDAAPANEGQRITIQRYGTGANPKIQRQHDKTATITAATRVGGGPDYNTELTASGTPFVAGDLWESVYFPDDHVTVSIITFTDSNTVTVNGDVSEVQGITLPQTVQIFDANTIADTYGLYLTNPDYITIDGVDFDNFFECNFNVARYVEIKNCTFSKCHGGNYGTCLNFGAWGQVNSKGYAPNDVTVDNCTFTDLPSSVSGCMHFTGNFGIYQSNITVKNCTITNARTDGIKIFYANTVLIENNTLTGLTGLGGGHEDGITGYAGTNWIIRYNKIDSFTQLILFPAGDTNDGSNFTDIHIYGNVFWNDTYWTGPYAGASPAIYCGIGDVNNPEFSGVRIWKNTFGYMGDSQGGGIWITKDATSPTLNDIVIHDNVFYEVHGPDYTGQSAYILAAGITNLDIDYNCYYACAKSSETEANSLTATDPLLVSYTGKGDTAPFDFHIGSGSPCNNAGDPALTSNVTVPATFVDIDGVTRTKNSGDMGAYELAGGGIAALPAMGGLFFYNTVINRRRR